MDRSHWVARLPSLLAVIPLAWASADSCMAVSYGQAGTPLTASAFREAEAATQASALDWTAIPIAERLNWSIILSVAGEDSGIGDFDYTTKAMKEAAAGAPRGGRYVAIAGKWKVLFDWSKTLAPSEPTSLQGYSWMSYSPSSVGDRTEPFNLLKQFEQGNVSFCLVRRRTSRAKDAGLNPEETPPWEECVLLPNGWENEFPAAWKRADEVLKVLGDATSKGRAQSLQSLAMDSNGPIATASLRVLAAKKLLDLKVARDFLEKSRRGSRTVGFQIIAKHAERFGLQPLISSIGPLVDSAKDGDECREWAAAAMASACFAWEDTPQQLFGEEMLRRAKSRSKALGLDAEKYSDIYELSPLPVPNPKGEASESQKEE